MASGSETDGFTAIEIGLYGLSVTKETIPSVLSTVFCDITRVLILKKFTKFFETRYYICTSMGFDIQYLVDTTSSDIVCIDFRDKNLDIVKEITINEFKNFLINHINEKYFNFSKQFGSVSL